MEKSNPIFIRIQIQKSQTQYLFGFFVKIHDWYLLLLESICEPLYKMLVWMCSQLYIQKGKIAYVHTICQSITRLVMFSVTLLSTVSAVRARRWKWASFNSQNLPRQSERPKRKAEKGKQNKIIPLKFNINLEDK